MPVFIGLAERGQSPIDFLAYHRAADALKQGGSPYLRPDQSLQIWRSFHQAEVDLRAAAARGQGREMLGELLSRPQQPGPYLYPPTLALLISQLQISAPVFGGLILAAILGFGWLWLRATSACGAWLGLIIFSWDVLASLSGGNVELALLFATLLAGRLLWDRRPMLAAPLIALVVLIKPFYSMFFIAFGLLQLASGPAPTRVALRSLALAGVGAVAIVTVEVYRWGSRLQADTLHYLLHALDHQWLVLPIAEQTPMSAWNRAPLQGLVSAGMPAHAAQWAALGLWLAFVAVTTWRARRVQLPFSLAFALAFVLLYWGRPVGWGLIYLELVVVVAVWPYVPRWQGIALICAALALMASHWWALAMTSRGDGLPLFTLQSAGWPWETWLVLPLSWLLVLRVTSPQALMPRPMAASERAGPGAGRDCESTTAVEVRTGPPRGAVR